MKNFTLRLMMAVALIAPTSVLVAQNDHTTQPDRYFLVEGQVANSCELIPAPPTKESARFAYDVEQYEWGKSMRDTERGKQAIQDANLNDGWLDRDFSEAFGFELTPENAPEIYRLCTGMKEDAGDLSTRCAKNHYMRPRPFMVFNEPSATPADEASLRKNGSYPSGHTAIGWATALVLSEIAPERIDQLLQRGYQFGQSRVICGAHWQSDIDNGRVVGAGAVAALHSDKKFLKQLDKAKKEYKKLLKKRMKEADKK